MWVYILVVLIAVIVLYTIWRCCIKKSPVRKDNIFLRQRTEDPEWLSKITSDELLKNMFDRKKVKDKYDVIIIGSGIGGLSAASILAQSGKKVLLLEQFERIGGQSLSFEEQGFRFPVGVHILTKMRSPRSTCLFLKACSEGKMEPVPFKDPYHEVIIDQKKYEFHSTSSKFVHHLSQKFPREKANIQRFVDLCLKMYKTDIVVLYIREYLSGWLRKLVVFILKKVFGFEWFVHFKKNSRDLVDEYFEDEDLKKIFLSLLYCIGTGTNMPASVYCWCFGGFLDGMDYVKNGTEMFSETFGRTILKYDGQMMVNADVTKILVDPKTSKVCGVQVNDQEKIFCEHVISTVGISNTYSLLSRKYVPKGIEKCVPGFSFFVIFCGFKKRPEELGVKEHHLVTIMGDNSKEDEFFKSKGGIDSKDGIFNPSAIYVTCYSEGIGHSDRTSAVIMFPHQFSFFEDWKDTKRVKCRGNEYENRKEYYVEETMKIVYKSFPLLEENLEVCFSGSCLSMRYYCRWKGGECCGQRLDQNRIFENYEKLIKGCKVANLYFGGIDSQICGGVGSACGGGIFAAGQVLQRNFFKELMNAKKIISKEKKEK